jgi:hypothetical protein
MPRMSLYLRKPELGVVRIHASNFFSGWGAKNLTRSIIQLNNIERVKKKEKC